MATKILILAANPKDTSRLRLDEEVREIENGLQRAQQRENFKVKQKWAVRVQDIRRAMLDVQPNIVHFSGHGEGEAGIKLEDESGETHLVSTEALAGFFKLFAEHVNCVVLNACYSEVQAEAIAEHIPYVIGMNQAIGDETAVEFAVAFYDALGAGKSVRFAYDLACNAIQMTNIPSREGQGVGLSEHLIPVLITKKSEGEEERLQEISSIAADEDQKGDIAEQPDRQSEQPPQELRQPLAPIHYALISLIAFVIGIGVLLLFMFKANDLVAQGIDQKVFYILLLPLGLSAGAFLFGVMRSYATYTGKALGGVLESGGPVVIFVLVVIGGFKLVPDTSSFALTVYVHGSKGKQDIVLQNKGVVMLDLAGERLRKPIQENGEAYFPLIPAKFRNQSVPLTVLADGYEVTNPDAEYVLTGKSIYVEMKRDEILAKVFGTIMDGDLNPLEGVQVSLDDLSAVTDENGKFELQIPSEKQKERYPLSASKDGYATGRISSVLPGRKIELILEKME